MLQEEWQPRSFGTALGHNLAAAGHTFGTGESLERAYYRG